MDVLGTEAKAHDTWEVAIPPNKAEADEGNLLGMGENAHALQEEVVISPDKVKEADGNVLVVGVKVHVMDKATAPFPTK